MNGFHERFVVRDVFGSDAGVVVTGVVQAEHLEFLKFDVRHGCVSVQVDRVQTRHEVFYKTKLR